MRRYAVLLMAGVLACTMLGAGDAASSENEKWQDLFDGKTLNGWVQRGGKAVYKVEDGCIVGQTVPKTPNSFLCTEKNFSNFILELDFKVDAGLNSGIQIRSESMKEYQNGRVHGYQVEIDPSARAWTGGIYDEGRRGWLKDLKDNEPARKAFKQSEWNHFRIECKGDTIKTWLNGVPAAELKDSMTPTGFIGLQVHANNSPTPLSIRWRNIRLQELDGQSDAGKKTALKALIIDGQNNHNWKGTTPVLKKLLEETGLFQVEVATTPGNKPPLDGFKPDFAKYDVIVLNYNGAGWPQETEKAFVEYMRNGGGLVIYHAADNPFPKWTEFNEMIGVGGWGGRNEKSGPMVRWRDGKAVLDNSPGPGGTHGPQHEFQVVIRDPNHPITAGLPEKWMHVSDELYSKMRGPARNMTVLATAYADPAKNGTGENEPMLITLQYGKGRVFHTMLGHDVPQLACVGFIVTFQRGTEWAATGKVTQTNVPADFPTADRVSLRK